jgi:hypothetical protein
MADEVCFRPRGSKKYHTTMECLKKGFRDLGQKVVRTVETRLGAPFEILERRQRGLQDLDATEVRGLMRGRARVLLRVPTDDDRGAPRCREECRQCEARRRKGKGASIRDHLRAVGVSATELEALPRVRPVSEAQATAHVKAQATHWRLLNERWEAQRAEAEARRLLDPERHERELLARRARPNADAAYVHQASINSLMVAAREALRGCPRLPHDTSELWGGDERGRAVVRDLALRSGPDFEDLLGAVVGKIVELSGGGPTGPLGRADLLEVLAFNARDCYIQPVPERLAEGQLVCLHGRLARLLSTLDGVVEGWRVGVSNAMMRDAVATLAARVRDEGGLAEEFERRVSEEYGAGNEHAQRLARELAAGFD